MFLDASGDFKGFPECSRPFLRCYKGLQSVLRDFGVIPGHISGLPVASWGVPEGFRSIAVVFKKLQVRSG